MALGNTQSSPRVAEARQKFEPCKWLLLYSAVYETLPKHVHKQKSRFLFTLKFFMEREIYLMSWL